MSDGVLRLILSSMREKFEEESVEINEHDTYAAEVITIIDDALKYFSITDTNYEIWGFFIMLYLNNPDFNNPDVNIERPTLKNYEVTHDEEVNVYKTITYLSEISSYIPLTKSVLYDMGSISEYEYWDGRIINEDTYDSDVSSDDITNIKEIL
jgi:hypothetical protein